MHFILYQSALRIFLCGTRTQYTITKILKTESHHSSIAFLHAESKNTPKRHEVSWKGDGRGWK